MGRKQIFSEVIPASDFSLNTDFGKLIDGTKKAKIL